jgi:hypothetical protein
MGIKPQEIKIKTFGFNGLRFGAKAHCKKPLTKQNILGNI